MTHPRTKIVLASILLLGGVFGAYIFRKPQSAHLHDPPPAADMAIQRPAVNSQEEPAAPVQPRLLGRIDPVACGPPPAPEPLQPSASDPEVHADRDGSRTIAPADMPLVSPWANGRKGSTLTRPASTTSLEREITSLDDGLSERKPPRTHRVLDGDTLSKLAQRYLGQADRFYDIYEANRELLRTPDVLPIGSLLIIPDPTSEPTPATAPLVDIPSSQLQAARQQSTTVVSSRTATSYRVQAQDTLHAIARHFYGDANRYRLILEANKDKLKRPEDLREGMTLIIP